MKRQSLPGSKDGAVCTDENTCRGFSEMRVSKSSGEITNLQSMVSVYCKP